MTEQDDKIHLTRPELKQAEERSSVTPRVVHEAVRREGESELKRSSMSLAWSGLAAGLSMGFSLIMEGVLRSKLPETPWAEVISKLGYSAGFVIVILGRQQLFTENTLTPVLPFLRDPDRHTASNVGRLWAIVLTANLLGALIIATVLSRTGVFPPEVRAAFEAIGRQSLHMGFGLALLRGIFAGWLLALLVWVLPFAEHARFFVIIALTWMISLCGFTHIVAGSVDMCFLATAGLTDWNQVVFGYMLPVLIGNIVGGVALVTALNHAQVFS